MKPQVLDEVIPPANSKLALLPDAVSQPRIAKRIAKIATETSLMTGVGGRH